MKPRFILFAVLALATVGMAPFTSAKAAAVAAPPIQFTHEVTVDPQRLAGEPNLAIAQDGKQMYSSDPWGFSTTVSLTWKSEDGGAQWDNLHWFCPTNPLRPFCSRGGGDTEIQLGSGPAGHFSAADQPQRLLEADLNGLDTITCAYSTDGGRTFAISGAPLNPASTGHVCNVVPNNGVNLPGSDRPWIAVWPKDLQPAGATADKAYMVYDTGDTPPSGDASLISHDGGQTWSSGCTTISGSSCVGGAGSVGSRPGPLLINPATGTLYEFMGLSAQGAEVNISCNEGVSWGHVTITTGELGSTTNDFVVGAMDTAGGLYAAWTQDNGAFAGSPDPAKPWQVMYSHTTDASGTAGASITGSGCTRNVQGGTWSTPVALNGPSGVYAAEPTVVPTNATNVNFGVMPAIAAGAPGRVDVGYYGSTNALPSDPSASTEQWYLHMTQTLDGQSAVPRFNDVLASETPMHKGSICFSGIGCTGTGNRNLSDFFEIKPDPAGRAVIVYVDDNNSALGPPGAGFSGGPITSSVQQVAGPGLFGGNVAAPTASLTQSTPGFSNEVTDPTGDALMPAHQSLGGGTPGANNDGADITDLKITQKDTATLAMTFTMKGDPLTALVNSPVPHTGVTWLVTWHTHNLANGTPDDFWFASANLDGAGNASYLAGKPVSVFGTGSPKAFQYVSQPGQNSVVTGAFTSGTKTVEIDVPVSAIGGAAGGDILYGLTGYTEQVDASTAAASSIPAGVLSGSVTLFDHNDQTAPIDYSIAAGVVAAEVPGVPLLAAAGLLVVGGTLVARRRRRRLTT
ncbi:MAG: hypothetical protein M3019_04715 [Candidatus Dormibacteraeota bacterium]|nr:hypothetical protein [Candidatus Dormibacteraeota bacterium]